MADVADYTEFWVACAAAAPVLLIPAYLIVRQERSLDSGLRSGFSVGSVLLLAAATIYALVTLAAGTPVHGGRAGRIIELILVCAPVATLATSLVTRRQAAGTGRPPSFDAAGMPEVRD